MTDPLVDLPKVTDFLWFTDLRTGSVMIATLGIVHIIFYGCTFFMRLSYQLVTTWILTLLFSVFSLILLLGIQWENKLLISMWIWYSMIFVCLMFLIMLLYIVVFAMRKDKQKLFIVFLAILWYILTIYFIIVVNSHRAKMLIEKFEFNPTVNDTTAPSKSNSPGANTVVTDKRESGDDTTIPTTTTPPPPPPPPATRKSDDKTGNDQTPEVANTRSKAGRRSNKDDNQSPGEDIKTFEHDNQTPEVIKNKEKFEMYTNNEPTTVEDTLPRQNM